jgi:hypothetical protein
MVSDTIFINIKKSEIFQFSHDLLPLRAKFNISPARKEISSSDTAAKSYSALATTWSSSPLAQLILSTSQIKN